MRRRTTHWDTGKRGNGPLCGSHLRYLICSRQGCLGGLSFSSAAWRLGPRDEWIGWSEATRPATHGQHSLEQLVLDPALGAGATLGLALLGLATRRLAADWQQGYGNSAMAKGPFWWRPLSTAASTNALLRCCATARPLGRVGNDPRARPTGSCTAGATHMQARVRVSVAAQLGQAPDCVAELAAPAANESHASPDSLGVRDNRSLPPEYATDQAPDDDSA